MENNEIHIINQRKIEITGIKSVEGFDESGVFVTFENQAIIIYGEGMHVDALEIDDGRMEITGLIISVSFEKKKVKKSLRERLKR